MTAQDTGQSWQNEDEDGEWDGSGSGYGYGDRNRGQQVQLGSSRLWEYAARSHFSLAASLCNSNSSNIDIDDISDRRMSLSSSQQQQQQHQQQHKNYQQPQLTAKKMDCGEPGARGPVTCTRSRTYHMIIFMHHSNVSNMLLLLQHAACSMLLLLHRKHFIARSRFACADYTGAIVNPAFVGGTRDLATVAATLGAGSCEPRRCEMAKRPLALNYQTKCGQPRTLDDVATDRAGQKQQQQQQQRQQQQQQLQQQSERVADTICLIGAHFYASARLNSCYLCEI
ncbi:uncharacterized protein Dere_GG15461 [Drosophila erecta]|uniref:Uncharacterized protein n=1 Tax=Drosophila erecta TaxID=7220 RepID=B3NCP6_DROER|nr:uncharacterized protein Dere_GG15461 [Drosophila erecta]